MYDCSISENVLLQSTLCESMVYVCVTEKPVSPLESTTYELVDTSWLVTPLESTPSKSPYARVREKPANTKIFAPTKKMQIAENKRLETAHFCPSTPEKHLKVQAALVLP